MRAEALPFFVAAGKAFAALHHLFPNGQDVEWRMPTVRGVAIERDFDNGANTSWWSLVRADIPTLHQSLVVSIPRLLPARLALRECGTLVRDNTELNGPAFEAYKSFLTELFNARWVEPHRIEAAGDESDNGSVVMHTFPVLAPPIYLVERMVDAIRHYQPETERKDPVASQVARDAFIQIGDELSVQMSPSIGLPTTKGSVASMGFLVLGKTKQLPSHEQAQLITALIKAGGAGSVPYKVAQGIHQHCGEVLKKLISKDDDWRAAIELPADRGSKGGYRIRFLKEALLIRNEEQGSK